MFIFRWQRIGRYLVQVLQTMFEEYENFVDVC